MNTCDTCEHWKPDYRLGCFGYCGKAVSLITGSEPLKNDDVAVYGTTSYDGDTDPKPLLTGPKFGCIHWEAKE